MGRVESVETTLYEYKCSNCYNIWYAISIDVNFCPNCGEDMLISDDPLEVRATLIPIRRITIDRDYGLGDGLETLH